MLQLMEKRINIGINNHADETTRHGVLWVVTDKPDGTKESTRVPLILDKPNLVDGGLNYATWKRLKKQILKMGINATHMELKGLRHHFCYDMVKYKELYNERVVGMPQYQVGFS